VAGCEVPRTPPTVDQIAYLELPSLFLTSASDFSAIIARMKSPYRGVSILLAMFVAGVTCMGRAARAQASPSDDAQALVKQGQKLNSEGKQDEALKLYNQALRASPNFYEAHLESGVALDLKGDYAAAREHLKKAIEVAPADQKNRALRVMAISFAFESNSAEAEKYEKQVFDALMAKSDFEVFSGSDFQENPTDGTSTCASS